MSFKKLKIGNATFNVSPEDWVHLRHEQMQQVLAGTPEVINGWDCTPPGTPVPKPPKLTFGAYVRLIPHAVGPRPSPQAGEPLDPPPGWRAQSVFKQSGKLLEAFRNLAGFKDNAELGAWLQKELGEKKNIKIPFDALVKPYKNRFSLEIKSTVEYEMFSVDHVKLPYFLERKIILLLPVRLKHEVRKTYECTETGQLPLNHANPVAPEYIEPDRIPSVTDSERLLRKFVVKRQRDAVRRRIEHRKSELRELEEEERKLREQLKTLDEDKKE